MSLHVPRSSYQRRTRRLFARRRGCIFREAPKTRAPPPRRRSSTAPPRRGGSSRATVGLHSEPVPAPASIRDRPFQSASTKTSIQIKNLPLDEGPPIVGVVGLLRLARWRGLLGEPDPTTAGDRARGADAPSALGVAPEPRYRAQASGMGADPDGSPAPVGGDARRAGAKKLRRRGEQP